MGEISLRIASASFSVCEYYFTTAVRLRLASLTLGPSACGRLVMPATSDEGTSVIIWVFTFGS